MLCTACQQPLDPGARGSLCSRCWFAYLRRQFTTEQLREARAGMRVLEGGAVWFLPEEELVQMALF